jgi:predicted ATP-grasp superfamily ATP-dependent carboligase
MSTPFNLIRRLTTERGKGVIVWLLNIGAEKYWHGAAAGVIDRSEDRIVNRTEEMNLLLCRKQDILLLRETPNPSYLARLEEWGFEIPRIWVPELSDPWTPIAELVLRDEALLGRLADEARMQEDIRFVPYAVTRLEEQISERCGLPLAAASSGIHASLNDKIYNREIAEKLGFEVCRGRVCSTIEEIRETYRELAPHFGGRMILKEPFGASGKGLYLIDSEEKLSPILARLARSAKQRPGTRWLAEGWYEKQADVNCQIYISPSGEVHVFSIKRQILRDTVYIGSQIPAGLDEETTARLQSCGEEIGRFLYETGYYGVAGVDSIISSDGTLFPIIEINGRFTLSTYISFLGRVIGEQTAVFSRYFKHQSEAPLDHEQLISALAGKGLLYRPDTGEGVLVYTSGTLPVVKEEGADTYNGRIFTLIAAREWSAVEAWSLQLEALLAELQQPVKPGVG